MSNPNQFRAILDVATHTSTTQKNSRLRMADILYSIECKLVKPEDAVNMIVERIKSPDINAAVLGIDVLNVCVKYGDATIRNEFCGARIIHQLKSIVELTRSDIMRNYVLRLLHVWTYILKDTPYYHYIMYILSVLRTVGICLQSTTKKQLESLAKFNSCEKHCFRCLYRFTRSRYLLYGRPHCRKCIAQLNTLSPLLIEESPQEREARIAFENFILSDQTNRRHPPISAESRGSNREVNQVIRHHQSSSTSTDPRSYNLSVTTVKRQLLNERREVSTIGGTKKEKKKMDNQMTECCICLDNARCLAFVPCGHLCICKECIVRFNANFDYCPLCRTKYDYYVEPTTISV